MHRQVTRRHLPQSPCGHPAGSGHARPYSLLPPFQVPGGWGHLAEGCPHPAGARPSVPSLPGQDSPQHACSPNCSLHPSGREHAATRPSRTGPARCRSSSFPDQATRGFPTGRPAFQTLASALGTPASRAPLTSGPPGTALCLTVSSPSRHPDTAGPTALVTLPTFSGECHQPQADDPKLISTSAPSGQRPVDISVNVPGTRRARGRWNSLSPARRALCSAPDSSGDDHSGLISTPSSLYHHQPRVASHVLPWPQPRMS